MALAIDCVCGAHLEIDPKFAGQTIQCPDCRRSLQAPGGTGTPLRTSGLALASLTLALVGAFTIAGTLAAVVLGMLALRDIARRPERLAGKGHALAGIGLGALLTAVSLFAYLKLDLFGLDRWLRVPEWAGKLDYGGPLEVSTSGFYLKRPSTAWGVFRAGETSDFDFPFRPMNNDLILINVGSDGQAIASSFFKDLQKPDNPDSYREAALDHFRKSKLVELLRNRSLASLPMPKVLSSKQLPSDLGREVQEVVLDIPLGRRQRTFLMRVIRQGDSLYFIAAGTRKNRFSQMEDQLRQLVTSFKAGKFDRGD